MSGLPAANNDPLIPQLRDLSNSVYNPIFKSFSNLQDIITKFSNNLNHFNEQYPDNKTSKLLLDDINWAKESLETDFGNLRKIENHVKFLNADETLTNQREIIGLFVEFGDFFQDMILNNIEEVLKGVLQSLDDNDDKLKKCFTLNEIELIEIVDILKKYKIVSKILTDYFKKIETEKFNANRLNQNGLTAEEFNDFKPKVTKVVNDLELVVNNLDNL